MGPPGSSCPRGRTSAGANRRPMSFEAGGYSRSAPSSARLADRLPGAIRDHRVNRWINKGGLGGCAQGLSQAEPTSVGATLVVARLFSFAWSAPRRGRPQGTPLPSHMEWDVEIRVPYVSVTPQLGSVGWPGEDRCSRSGQIKIETWMDRMNRIDRKKNQAQISPFVALRGPSCNLVDISFPLRTLRGPSWISLFVSKL